MYDSITDSWSYGADSSVFVQILHIITDGWELTVNPPPALCSHRLVWFSFSSVPPHTHFLFSRLTPPAQSSASRFCFLLPGLHPSLPRLVSRLLFLFLFFLPSFRCEDYLSLSLSIFHPLSSPPLFSPPVPLSSVLLSSIFYILVFFPSLFPFLRPQRSPINRRFIIVIGNEPGWNFFLRTTERE